jgi:hypothetical protein
MNNVVVYKKREYFISDLVSYSNHFRRLKGRDIDSTYTFLDSENYLDELIGYIKLLTNDEYFLKHTTDYSLLGEYDGTICICGCDKCHSLFIVRHIPSSIGFAVGSECIKKFFPEQKSKLRKIKNKEICIQCNEPLYYGNYKGHTKNAEKDKNGNNKHLGHCITCWNS